MTRNYSKISPEDVHIASILGGRRSFYKYGAPWLRIRSSVSGTNVNTANLSDQRSAMKSAPYVDVPNDAAETDLQTPLNIDSGPVGEARLDDQS